MEKRLAIPSTGTSPITALAYHPLRREVVTGHEDGCMKFWELDSGHPTSALRHHKGWISDLLYWSDGKVLFSSSVDGTIVQWSSSAIAFNAINLEEPVFCLQWSPRKEQLIVGKKSGVSVFNKSEYKIPGHSDVVRCLACMGNRVFSGGYDRKLIIYEVLTMAGDGETPLKMIFINHSAHDAGITCLQVSKDSDSSTWIVTGSFDKKVKIWTADGKTIHIIQCSYAVSGVCYVPQTKVLWVSAGSSHPHFFDPKSGESISEFVPVTGKDSKRQKSPRNCVLQLLKYFPEVAEVVGTTVTKEVLSWRYNHSCCVCMQRSPGSSHIETLTYTSKVPILIFSGSFGGEMTRWERLQLNLFMYSQETLTYREQLSEFLENEEGEQNMMAVVAGKRAEDSTGGGEEEDISEDAKEKIKQEFMKEEYRGFLKSLFVESLDLLVASALDGKIFVWGYDEKTVAVLTRMQQKAATANGQSVTDDDTFATSPTGGTNQKESNVISRVAGFTCLHILNGHTSCVTGLALVEDRKEGKSHLLSVSWDLSLCVWNLESAKLVAQLTRCVPSVDSTPDTVITDLAYSKDSSVFAYSCSNQLIYLRQFALRACDMQLVATLQGHTAEVSQVCWNEFCGKWISGSEDETIRMWAADGSSCDQIVSCGGPVTVLCIDKTHGYIIAGVQSSIKVYNCSLELLQVSRGHADSIRTIIHIPELGQYLSAGWDSTVQIWNAYHPREKKTEH